MPGPWTPEHRAAYEATMEAKRAKGGAYVKPPRKRASRTNAAKAERGVALPNLATIETTLHDLVAQTQADAAAAMAALERLAGQVDMRGVADVAERMRATALRIEDRLAVMSTPQAAPEADPRLIAAMGSLTRRVAALEGVVASRAAHDDKVLKMLARIDSRPARIIEHVPSHRRESEGGTPIRIQRQRDGLSKRSPRGRGAALRDRTDVG